MNRLDNFFKTSSSIQAIIVLVFIAAIMIVGVLLNNFSRKIETQQEEFTTQTLHNTALQYTNYVNSTFSEHIKYIDYIADSLKNVDDLTGKQALDTIKIMAAGTVFERLAIDFPVRGQSYTSDGYITDISGMNYIKHIPDGKTFITDVTYAVVDGQPCVSIISPIIQKGKVVAAVRGTIYTRNLNNILATNFFKGIGYFYIIDGKGDILSRPSLADNILPYDDNFFTAAKKLTFTKGDSLTKIIENIKAGKSGQSSYTYDDQERYSYYMPIGINDWTIFISIPTANIDKDAEVIKNITTNLVGKISLTIFAAFLIVILAMRLSRKEVEKINKHFKLMTAIIPGGIVILEADGDFAANYISQGYYDLVGYTPQEFAQEYQNKGLETLYPQDRQKAMFSIKRQLYASGVFSITVRILHKIKGYIWVHLQGRLYSPDKGTEKLYMVAVDISEQLDILKKLQDEKSFNKLITTLSDDGFFDYDNINHVIRYSKNFANRIGISEVLTDYPASLLATGRVADDSTYMFNDEKFEQVHDGPVEEEIHFILPDGQDAWYSIKYSVITNDKGKAVRTIGKLTDITKQNARISELSDKVNRDPLTDLYNKTATERLIKNLINTATEKDRHALMIIDIDDFKDINDKLGHLQGDIFLKDFSATLKSLFRTDDVVGRIGGDEFFVFLKNFNSIEILKTKARRVCKTFKNIHSEHNISCETSVSIGISIYPDNGHDFTSLYKKADTALYRTKRNGKNNFSIYGDKLFKDDYSLNDLLDIKQPLSCEVDSTQSTTIDKLGLLHIHLQNVVEDFNFSRGFIYEQLHDQDIYHRIIETLSENVVKNNNLAETVSADDVAAQVGHIKDKGIDIHRRSVVSSPFFELLFNEIGSNTLVTFAIMDGNELKYVIGFDDARSNRKFSKTEISDILSSCNAMAKIMYKHNLQPNLDLPILNALDNMDNMVCVVDMASYKVLYANKHARELMGDSCIGEICYKVLFQKDQLCEICPIHGINDEVMHNTVEVFSPKYNIFLKVTATVIGWTNGQKACLITATDISAYKQQ